ncbi:hypothetical protein L596_006087 [Steinernema carpocapsae]|uniref:Uncharacterized protein n=1 Tax=Steinernema carpocapsae TaxID=34508 RepID=A0A4U8V2L5_STECR|nr:hypothetical protein L596_006087 [Steinernema carpocapsae]
MIASVKFWSILTLSSPRLVVQDKQVQSGSIQGQQLNEVFLSPIPNCSEFIRNAYKSTHSKQQEQEKGQQRWQSFCQPATYKSLEHKPLLVGQKSNLGKEAKKTAQFPRSQNVAAAKTLLLSGAALPTTSLLLEARGKECWRHLIRLKASKNILSLEALEEDFIYWIGILQKTGR